MSGLKFFFLFELIPKRRKVLFSCSYKLAVQIISLIITSSIVISFIFDLKYSNENTIYTIIKYLIFSSLNIISSYYLFISAKGLNYKKAYLGHLFLFWSFILHLGIFLFNSLFLKSFFPLVGVFSTKFNAQSEITNYLVNTTIPQVIYLVFEFICLFICYLYTKNLGLGKDALVDGQTFDRYVENLASSDNSRQSSPRNSVSNLGIPLDSLNNSYNDSDPRGGANINNNPTVNQNYKLNGGNNISDLKDKFNLGYKV